MATKTLVLLTYNEIEGSRALYPNLPFDLFNRVVLVDGGSTDGTVEFWKDHGIEIIKQRSPGRGTAFIIAQNTCKEDILLFFSPDGNENPNDIRLLLSAIESGADLAIATRFGRGAKSLDAEGHRRFGNLFFTFLVNSLFRANVTDAVNGFRAIKRRKMYLLNLPYSRFEIEFQMTIRAAKLGFKITEIPTTEFERIGGYSKAGSFSVGVSYLKVALKELLIGRRFLKNFKAGSLKVQG
ncbi:MAG: glycosyltransferase family 2 protein [Candidatus Hodarchaeales archaeon]|jgi:glycosyltransferase involved in cell wall biosynthesis